MDTTSAESIISGMKIFTDKWIPTVKLLLIVRHNRNDNYKNS